MRTRTSLFALLLIVSMSIVLYSCSSEENDSAANETTDEVKVESIRVLELDYKEVSRTITQTASLQPLKEVHLAPAQPGRVDRVHVESGSRVTKGQLLVEMDRTQLHQANIQLQSLETEYNRLKKLRETGSVSQQQYDQVESQYEVTKSNVAFLKENTNLYAPFSGVVAAKYFENGEMYSGAPNTQVGKAAVLHIVQTNSLKAIVNIPERFYPHVKPGMDVRISTDVYSGQHFSGKVRVVHSIVDPITRTIPVELTISNSNDKLKPGMFARAHFNLKTENVFTAPALAILKLQGSNERYVFLREDGRAKRIVVELGDRFDDMVEIISDQIEPGAQLIVAGQSRLTDGALVSTTTE